MGRGAYLRDMWNWLDFVVVVVGWLTPSGATSSASGAALDPRAALAAHDHARPRNEGASLVDHHVDPVARQRLLPRLFFFTIFESWGCSCLLAAAQPLLHAGDLADVDGTDFAALGTDAAEGVAAELATQLASGVTNLTIAAANGTNLALVREADTVRGGDWMCVAPHEEAALGVASPLRGAITVLRTPVWSSSGISSSCTAARDGTPTARHQCCTWEKKNPGALRQPKLRITSFDAFHRALLPSSRW